MAGKSQQGTGETKRGPGEKTHDELASLYAVIREVALGDDCQSLSPQLKEHTALQQQHDSIQNAYNTNLDTLLKTRQELEVKDTQHLQALNAQKRNLDDAIDAKNKFEQDMAAIHANFAEKVKQVDELETNVQKLIARVKDKENRIIALEETERQRDELRSQLATVTDKLEEQANDLSEASDSLELIRSFVEPLSTIRDNRDRICKEFKSMFHRAHQLMLKWLHRDLENSCLANTKLWERINDHPSIPRDLSLPSRNSSPAKEMRVAAGLLIFARAIANRVMRSTYLVEDNDIDNVLAELAKQDVNQEVYVRASLLKVLPDRQSRGREEAIRVAVQEVVDAVSVWVPETD